LVTLGTGTQTLPVYHPTADSFQRGVWIQATLAYPSNVVATLVQKQDAPFNVINTISLTDTQQRFIFGPVGGIDLYYVNLLGGYFFANDPKASAAYSNPLTSTPTGAAFSLYLPLEIDMRDGLGSLENKNQASTFNVNVTVETAANVFGTPPTNAATVQFTFTSDSYLQPAATDAQGNALAQSPQALGTTQFWAKSNFQLNAGSNPNVYLNGGIGFPIRNIILEAYDVASGFRSTGETNWASPLTITYKGVTIFNRNKIIWQEKMARAYGLTSVGAGVAEPANSKPAGVYCLPFNMDFTNQPGSELRAGYLQTVPGTQLLATGSWALSTTLYELVNYVAPANGNPGSIRAGGR
jgi:hypothetical protein